MIPRKHLASLLVLLMVALAGCSALPFVGDEKTTPTPEPNNDSIDYPYGWNDSGLQRFATGEDNALMQENSLTVTFNRTIKLANSQDGTFQTEAETIQIHRVNAVQEQWYITSKQVQENVRQEYFYVDNTEYSQTTLLTQNNTVDAQSYDSSRRSFNKQEAFQISGPEVLVLGVDYNQPEVTTYNGKEVLHYQATGLDKVANNSPIYTIGDTSNVSDFESDLYVGKEDGQILYIETRIFGERGDDAFRATLSFKYENLSSTTIEEPEWVQTARNETGANESTNVTIGDS